MISKAKKQFKSDQSVSSVVNYVLKIRIRLLQL